ncbi:MAG: ComEA family DNA-binding protein [Lachnospiraceae bacterium]|nr:ComEA family DNA-binding protein [Lachnospiraceae bacterium]
MREKLKIVISVFIILICSTACGKERIEYISTTTQEKAVESSESISYQVYENVETATDGDYDIIASEELVPVHVCGAVNNPGLYYMKADSLKADALALAGGFAPDAATDYINLAEMITYGEKIYFPYVDELQVGYNLNDSQAQGADNLVNINTATKDELMTLPGIGESKAEAIIKYRDKNGPFQNIEDITNIPGIKEGVYNNIKDNIVVN